MFVILVLTFAGAHHADKCCLNNIIICMENYIIPDSKNSNLFLTLLVSKCHQSVTKVGI